MSVYYCYSLFYLIFVSFVFIDRQGLLEALVLSVILNQIQMFVVKLENFFFCEIWVSKSSVKLSK